MATRRTGSESAVNTAAPALSAGRVTALAWHGTALVVLTYALRRLPLHATISGFDIEDQFGSHYQFLTVLGLWFSRLTTMLAISADLTPQSNAMRRVKTMLSALTMPAEILISLLYWPILLFDPSLLIPPRKVADPRNPAQFIWETIRLPLLDDLSFHAAPAIFLLVDYLAFSPPFPKDIHPLLVSAFSTAAYGIWVEICHSKNGTYPYPLLAVLTDVQRYALYAGCAVIFVAIVALATMLHGTIDRALGREWSDVAGVEGQGFVGAVDAQKSKHTDAARGTKKNK